jgi:NAD(P)-dependent dehydrogenase (short-subunit alcohol dehydrogenase family)
MLRNQKVIVLGGSSGMGLATARLLAPEGAHVVIASRSCEKLDAALRAIGVSPDRPACFQEFQLPDAGR